MTTITNFREYYKTLSPGELLFIVQNPDNYQPLAVEAATQELVGRGLSEAEINAANEALSLAQLKKENKSKSLIAIEAKIKNTGNSLLDAVNPILTEMPQSEKVIRFTVISFCVLFLLQVVRDFQMLQFYLEFFSNAPLESFVVFLPYVLLPVALYTFWKRKTIGWILLCVLLIFTITGALWGIFQAFTYPYTEDSWMDNLIPKPSLSSCLFQLLLIGGTLFVICGRNIREVFSIDNSKMQKTIVLAAIVSFLLVMFMG